MIASGPRYLSAIKQELAAGRNQWKRGDKILDAFGYVRRRQSFVDLISHELARRGMIADPPITTFLDLDGFTSFRLKESSFTPAARGVPPVPAPPVETAPSAEAVAAEEEAELEEPPTVDMDNPADLSLTVRDLDCAEREPLCIRTTRSWW